MDKIYLNKLKCTALIGTLPEERRRRQSLTIDLELRLDLSRAAVSDDLRDTVDYSEIERRTVELVSGSEFFLLEALAGAVGRLVMGYPALAGCRVRIEKPRASAFGKSVALELEFDRNSR